MKKILVWLAVALGVLCVALAVLYVITPSGNLPSMLPGYVPGGTNIHYKHAIGSLLLGIALFAYAWFTSAPYYAAAVASENVDESVQ